MKKILIFSTAYFPFVGGAEIAVKEITDRIQNESSFEYDMITAKIDCKLSNLEKIGNVNVYRIGIGWPILDKYLLAFWGHRFAEKLNKKNNYSAIWSIMASYGGFAAMFFKKRNLKIPFLLTLQEGDDLEYINKRVGFFEKYFKQIFSKADYIQAISSYLAKWAKKMGSSCPIKVVPNAVDIDNFNRDFSEDELNKLKSSLGKKEDDIFLIHDGRLVFKNALDDVIKALVHLPDNIKFLSVGTGQDLDKLKKIAKECKVVERVIFIDFVSQKDLVKYLKISDIFVRPSLSEGLGNSFLEAMFVGLPIIGTPIGGIPDFLKDEETGLFCEVNNPKSIAEKVKLLISDNSLRDKLIKNGKKLVIEKYNWDVVSKDMEKIFLEEIIK